MMGEFADYALDEVMDDIDAWESGDIPEEDGYPLFHPMWGDGPFIRIRPRKTRSALAVKEGKK